MPPKVKVTREDILSVSMEIIRKSGAESLNARDIAASLNCSTQPIFSNFATMSELKLAVVNEAEALYQSFISREVERGEFPPYKASGIAYIKFAEEEKELFKLLYMRDRSNENVIDDDNELGREMVSIVKGNTGLKDESAKLFHLEMWIYVHGIASMVATGYLEFDKDLISKMLTDCYQGLKTQYEKE